MNAGLFLFVDAHNTVWAQVGWPVLRRAGPSSPGRLSSPGRPVFAGQACLAKTGPLFHQTEFFRVFASRLTPGWMLCQGLRCPAGRRWVIARISF
jgi:hypothetical protein